MTSSSGRKRSVVGRVVELLGDDLPAQLQQQDRSFFGLGRSGQDGAVVILQQLEPMLDVARRSDERREGKECVSPCRSRWPRNADKNQYIEHEGKHRSDSAPCTGIRQIE